MPPPESLEGISSTMPSASVPSEPVSPTQRSSSSSGPPSSFALPNSTKNIVKDTLKVLKGVAEMAAEPAGLSGIPGLKEGLAGIAKLLQKILDMKANVEGVEKLNKRIVNLVDNIEEIRRRSGDRELPKGRQEEIARLMEKWEEIGARASYITNRPRMVRVFTSSDDVKDLQDLVNDISSSIQDSILTNGILNIEGYLSSIIRNVENVGKNIENAGKNVEDVQQRVKKIEKRLDATFMSTYAKKAQFDSIGVRRKCLEGTRTGLLDRLQAWVTAACTRTDAILDDAIIQWINGFAGTGKTTIAYTMADYCKRRDFLAANFFCSRSDAECSDANLIFLTVSRQICYFHAPFKGKVQAVLEKDPDVAHAGLSRQFEELIVLPLEAVKDTFPKSVIILDALDECLDKVATRTVLTTIAKFVPRIGQYVAFIVTSRPERHVTAFFEKSHKNSLKDSTVPLVLHEIPLEEVQPDIRLYANHEFKEQATFLEIEEDWPSDEEKERLVEMSHGLFIFIATAIAFIMSEKYQNPKKQLQSLFDNSSTPPTSGGILSFLYSQIVTASYSDVAPELAESLRRVLGTIVLAQEPLSLATVAKILELDENDVKNTLSGLKSVLSIPADRHKAIHIIHPTFAEFMLHSSEAFEQSLPPNNLIIPSINTSQQHWLLFSRCLIAMNTLKRDMIRIRHPARFKSEIDDLESKIDKSIEPHIRYACSHWVTHLLEGLGGALTVDVLAPLRTFMGHYLLRWFEACSLLGIMDKVVPALIVARKSLQTLDEPFAEVISLLADGLRFALAYLPLIYAAPLAVYSSALSLTPRSSDIHTAYSKKPRHALLVLRGAHDDWESCIDTLSLPDIGRPCSIAFHPDGRSFATGWSSGVVVIWNTYARTRVLSIRTEETSNSRCPLAFSPDGTQISTSTDGRWISIWQTSSGERIHSWKVGVEIDSDYVTSVAYSARGSRFLSTTDDGQVEVWETSNWKRIVILKARSHGADSDSDPPFKPPPPRSYPDSEDVFEDKTLSIQDGPTQEAGISPDGNIVAYTQASGDFVLYDVSSRTSMRLNTNGGTRLPGMKLSPSPSPSPSSSRGRSFRPFSRPRSFSKFGSTYQVSACAFSPDGRYLAGATRHCTVVWKLSDLSSAIVPTEARRLVFSPDGAHIGGVTSAGSIILCNVLLQEWPRIIEGDGNAISDLSWSPDGILLVSARAKNIQIWDAAHRYPAATTECCTSSVYRSPPLTASSFVHTKRSNYALFPIPEGILHLPSLGIDPSNFTISSRLPASAPTMKRVMDIPAALVKHMRHSDWEYITGKLLTVAAPGTAISPDGMLVAYSNIHSSKVAVCSLQDGVIVTHSLKYTGYVTHIAFSPDSRRLAAGSSSGTIVVWEIATGSKTVYTDSHRRIGEIVFSSDGRLVAFSAVGRACPSGAALLFVMEVAAQCATGMASCPGLSKCIMTFADDDKHLLVLGENSCGHVFDAATGAQLHSLKHLVDSISFSQDDTGIEFTDTKGTVCKVALWKPGSRIWPDYGITQDGWVYAVRPGRKERLCYLPPGWRDTFGWKGYTACAFKERKIVDVPIPRSDVHVIEGKYVVLDFSPLLDSVSFWNDP